SGCNATSKRWCVAMTPYAREEHTHPFVTPPPRTRGATAATSSARDGLPRLDVVDTHVAERARRELAPELLRRPGEDRERAVMDGQDLGHAEQLNGERGLPWAHRVVAADGQHRDVRRVQVADQAHVGEHVRVAREVHLRA